MNFIKKHLLQKELRELELRKEFPNRYSNSEPNYDGILDRMIRDTKKKIKDSN